MVSIKAAEVRVLGIFGWGTTLKVALYAVSIRGRVEAFPCIIIAFVQDHGEHILAEDGKVVKGRGGPGNRGRSCSSRSGTRGGSPREERGERQEEDQDRGQSERLLLRLWGIGR